MMILKLIRINLYRIKINLKNNKKDHFFNNRLYKLSPRLRLSKLIDKFIGKILINFYISQIVSILE